MCILRPMVEFQPLSFVDNMSLSLILVVMSVGVCVSFCGPVCFCFCFFFVCVVFVSSSLLVSSMILRVRFFFFFLLIFSGVYSLGLQNLFPTVVLLLIYACDVVLFYFLFRILLF